MSVGLSSRHWRQVATASSARDRRSSKRVPFSKRRAAFWRGSSRAGQLGLQELHGHLPVAHVGERRRAARMLARNFGASLYAFWNATAALRGFLSGLLPEEAHLVEEEGGRLRVRGDDGAGLALQAGDALAGLVLGARGDGRQALQGLGERLGGGLGGRRHRDGSGHGRGARQVVALAHGKPGLGEGIEYSWPVGRTMRLSGPSTSRLPWGFVRPVTREAGEFHDSQRVGGAKKAPTARSSGVPRTWSRPA